MPSQDNYAYVGLECGCSWDEEHGLGFLLYKDRIVKIGGAEESFNEWECYKDNGTYEEKKKEWERISQKIEKFPKPKKYQPHPKYDKLKPSQITANKMYENYLIERGYNEEFKELVEFGKIDINVNKGLSMTYLERAAQFNNEEIVKYLMKKNPKSKKGVIQKMSGHCNKELVEYLLENGVDINEKDPWGRTILSIVEQNIEGLKRRKDVDLQRYENFANWLKSKGGLK